MKEMKPKADRQEAPVGTRSGDRGRMERKKDPRGGSTSGETKRPCNGFIGR